MKSQRFPPTFVFVSALIKLSRPSEDTLKDNVPTLAGGR